MAQTNLSITLSGRDNLTPVIRNAQRALEDLGQRSTKLEDIQKGFDKIKNSSAPLSRKISDIRKQMEALVASGEKTSEQGEEMYKKLSEAAKEYDRQLRQIQQDTRNVGDESSKVKGIDFKGIGGDLINSAGLGGVTDSLGKLTAMVNPTTAAIAVVGGTMIAAGKAASDFELHLDSLQSLTGLTEKEMKNISDGAVEMSKGFNASAGEIVDAMKLIGSQAPELLKNSDALMEVTKAANVLSEAAEIDVVESAKAITGTMNQMGASASEATDIINTFAAASQQGSADVAYLNKAFEKSGTAASSAGMNYVELASAIESIAPKFSSADVAGSQLASTLLKLSMSGNSDFMPSVVGMSKALENLAKAEMDDVAMKKLVGESNITMLKSLIQAKDQFDSYCTSLKGTNTAYEQMRVNNDNLAGTINSLKSAWDAFLITLGQSGLIQGIADNIMKVMEVLMEIVNVISDVIKAFESFGDVGEDNTNIVKIQLDALIKVIRGVGEVLNMVVRIAAKVFNSIKDVAGQAADWIGDKWNKLKKVIGDNAFARVVINAFNKVIDAAANMINSIKKYWNKLKEWLGLKTEANIDVKVSHTELNPETVGGTANTGKKGGVSGSGKGKKSSAAKKNEKIDYLVSLDDGSLDVAEKKLQAWQNKLKITPTVDKEGIRKCNEEIDRWTREKIKRSLIIEGKVDAELIEATEKLEKEIQQLESKRVEIQIETENRNELSEINSQLEELHSKEINLTVNGSTEELFEVRKLIGQLEDRKVALEISSNKDDIKEISSQLEELHSKEINLTVNGSTEELFDIKKKISELEEKKINIEAEINSNKEELSEISSQLEELHSKEISLTVNGSTEELFEVKKMICELKDRKVNIETDIDNSVNDIDTLNFNIDKLKSKLANISIHTDTNSLEDLDREIQKRQDQLILNYIKLGYSVEIQKGSKAGLENEIKKLEEAKKILFQTNADPDTIKMVEDEIETLKRDLEKEEIRLGIKPFIEEGSLADIKRRIKEKEDEIQLALNTDINPDSMKRLQTELDNLRKEEEAKEIELGIKYNIPSVRVDEKKWEKGSLDDKRQSLSNANSKAEQVRSDYSLRLINADEAKKQLAQIRDELKSIFPELDIDLHINDDGTITTAAEDIERLKSTMGATSDIVGSFGNVFSSLGGAIEDSAGQVLSFAGQSLNAISQIIPQIATLIAAKQAEAMASGTASGASLPFPANLAAIASIVATIAGIFASLPKFESGGVVGGSSYYGDKLLARVNSGELILNKAQQSKLYKTIESSEVGKSNILKGDVNFTISGSALKGTLRNYDQKMSKIK